MCSKLTLDPMCAINKHGADNACAGACVRCLCVWYVWCGGVYVCVCVGGGMVMVGETISQQLSVKAVSWVKNDCPLTPTLAVDQ